MIAPKIIQALENADPAIRKKAIIALGKSQDQGALPILAKVYRNDPDPEVRDYARKAGVMLKKALETPAPHVELAREAVEQAQKYLAEGKTEQAIHILHKALAIDPMLRFDPKTRQIIHRVIGEKDETHSLLKLVGKTFTMADEYSQFQSQYYKEGQTLIYSDEATHQMILRDIPPELVQLTVDIHDYKSQEADGTQFIKTIKRGGRTQKAYVLAQALDDGEWLIQSAWIEGESDPVSAYNPDAKKKPSRGLVGILNRILGQ